MARNYVLRDVTCVVCGITFQAKRRDAKKCSGACAIEYKRAYDAARYDERKDEIYARVRAWYGTNRDHKRAYDAQYREQNADSIRERKRTYNSEYAKRPDTRERSRVNAHRRRVRKLRNGVFDITPKEIARLYARYNGLCAYCDNPAEHLDHVVPIARGGGHSIGNLLPACAPCNMSKSHKYIMEWRTGKIVPYGPRS